MRPTMMIHSGMLSHHRLTMSMMMSKGRLLPSITTTGRQLVHSSLRLAASTTSTSTSDSVEAGPNALAAKSRQESNDDRRQRRAIEARGVSVVYQQSATAIHRRNRDDDTFRHSAFSSGVSSGAPTPSPGGSVAAKLSATERHRQQNRLARKKEFREIGMSVPNPSVLKILIQGSDTDDDTSNVSQQTEASELSRKQDGRQTNAVTSAIVIVTGASSFLLFVSTLV